MTDLTYRAGALVVFTTRCDCHGRPTCWYAKCGRCGGVLSRHGFARDDAVAAGLQALDLDHRCDATMTDAPVNGTEHKRRAQRRQAAYRASRTQPGGVS